MFCWGFFLPAEENQTTRGAPQAGEHPPPPPPPPPPPSPRRRRRSAPLLPARPGPAGGFSRASARRRGEVSTAVVEAPPVCRARPALAPGARALCRRRPDNVRAGGAERSGAGARPAGGRGTRPGPAPRPPAAQRPPAAPDRRPPPLPPSGWAAASVNQATPPARRGLAAGRSLERRRRAAARGEGGGRPPRPGVRPPPPSPALCRRLRAPSPGSRGGLVVPPRGRLPASRPATAPPQEIPAPAVRGRPGGRGAAGANRRPPAPLSPPFPAAAGVLYPRGGPRGAAAFPLARGRGGRPPRPPRSSRGLRAAARREQGCCRRKGTALQVARQGEPSPCRRPTGKASGLSRLSRLPAEARRTAHFGGRRPEAAR